jgi:superfamily II DNA helicase RecQ
LTEIDFLKSRGVTELIHFTPVTNLPSILANGIIPRNRLEQEDVEFTYTDEKRHDGKEHINLSITNPNIRMFYKLRKRIPVDFVVLTIDTSILSKYRHSYRATNAASNKAMPCSVEELFSGNRPEGFQNNWTTDNQAEVLVDEIISPEYILSVQFPLEGKKPSDCISQSFNETKKIIEQNKLSAKLVINHEKFAWNSLAAGYGQAKTYSAFFESWKADFTEYEQIVKVIDEYKWSTKFDSIAVANNELERVNKNLSSFNRRNIARWQLEYYRPSDAPIRTDNELSALSVMEKIILRGRITTVSRSLENSIEGSFVSIAHQIQAAVIELVKFQKLRPAMKIFVDETIPYSVVKSSIDDIRELSSNVCSLYDCKDFLEDIITVTDIKEADLIISNSVIHHNLEKVTALITNLNDEQDIIDFDFIRVQNPVTLNIQNDILKYLLGYIFGFDEFRENQIDGILRGLTRQDSIVLLPTGSGKSVVFQLLSLITPGVAIVVSPIISLIEDQIINLYNKGIDRVTGISSAMDTDDRDFAIDGITKGQFIISYVSPERFQNAGFINSIQYYTNTNIISVVAIDEAHCVSEWGHDFRTAYLGLAQTCRRVCKTGNAVPPLLALTGTASASVLRDMQHDLGIIGDEAVIQPKSFDRPEIIYRVYSATSNNKQMVLEDIIKNKLPKEFKDEFESFYQTDKGENTNCGLVFCQNVNGSFGLLASENQIIYGHLGVGDVLEKFLPGKVGLYSGTKPKRLRIPDSKWNEEKRLYAARLKNNEHSVMVCTKAFGMGIDKPNIRWIVHYGISGSLESYYQEAGRAARDKKTSYAYLILSDDFPELNQKILNPASTNVEDIAEIEESKGEWNGDDISRSLYFHTSTFKGIENEIECVKSVLGMCNKETWRNQRFHVPFSDNKNEIEKAIYRLQLLGFFQSYSVDYQSFGRGYFVIEAEKFDRNQIINNYIEYIRAYQDNDEYAEVARKTLKASIENITNDREFIIKVIETLLREFTYKVVEEGRRRATLNMLEAAKAASMCKSDDEIDAEFRKRLLAYLSTDMKNAGKKSARLKDIINNATDIGLLNKIIRSSNNRVKKENLVGETDRLLEAYPQHYGLHYIKSAMYMSLGNYSKFTDSLQTVMRFGEQNYGLSKQRISEDIIKLLNTKEAEHIEAASWNELIPEISNLLSFTEDDLYEQIKLEQAKISRQVNSMAEIANLVNSWRQY